MATINLGAIKFNWKGAYNSGTSYAVDDVVSSGGNSYVCIQAHSNQAVGNATAYWNIMSSAGTNGTNGTDVGTTITTQGDILYRDGSGLQRLAKPASDMYLKNTSAGAVSWSALSSDFVKLETQEITSNAGSVTFKGFANSIYGSYQLEVSDLQKSGTGDYRLNFRWCINNGNVTSGGYRASFNGQHFNSSGNTNINVDGNWDSDHIQLTNWNMPDTRNSGEQVRHLSMTITNLSNASYYPVIHYKQISPHPGGTYTNHDVGGGYHAGSETKIAFGANDGFTLFPAGDQIGKGIFSLYGRKK